MKVTVCSFVLILAFISSVVTHCLNLVRLFFRSFARSYVGAFVYLPVYPFVHPFGPVFIYYFVRAFVRWVSYSFVLSFNLSFVFSSVILCAPRFVYFCGLLFLNQIICLCEGLLFLSTNSFLSCTNV